ncbi:hypothetical protein IBT50_25335 [Bacillus sp. S70]|uniref:hypothetical protein n=1 Tax=unclassified Bacillus (in: firmicutes) TaxID=185979 RepID=UPI001909A692|nr:MULTISPECIES: hypothetical protein [unclassified Bacillus (in: firmicutes)]MBJ9983568.1 hypothetical protein [Bacillus sp. S29]MBK0104686.1 hypothetical protein [Bacillus sp. S70]MBK0110032.1 hypothetical protein [Bacillus sp. S73]MBK0138813.1 hypothetical protein [Bacillus sp. S72]MBK0148003.1 hypothetical protein [Bacillus sp. S74]
MHVVIVCSSRGLSIGTLVEEIREEFNNAMEFDEMIKYEDIDDYEEEKLEYPRHEVKVIRSQVIISKPKHIRARTTC